ncbi:uncharacterized protein LOC129903559 [Solanum dulcamara]|uniref:uncharacterized protein LOC129903559 n=1 Tax=Solanum dulcamara TaxID=45834 RepID=UPI0024860D52|nr:uncharacterized protein LOC129903559 [Solanum dulcamara]
MILVNTTFDGKGYGGWRRGILIALSAKNKVVFIDGSIIPPSNTPDSHISRCKCNNMVISWLLNSLSKEIAESVFYSKTTKQLWEELEERFGQNNGPLLYQLSKDIGELAQGNLDIATYYTKLKRLWDELDSLDTCQTCTCDCSYGVNYSYSVLISDEKHREVQISQHPGATIFYASKQPYAGHNYVADPSNYLYCKRTNHTADNCYRLIDIPADFKFTKSKRMGTPAKSNAAYLNGEIGNNSGDKPMTQDRYHNLYQLLQHVK